jgi:raffinose/stachyose/melibiose transport system permease protein
MNKKLSVSGYLKGFTQSWLLFIAPALAVYVVFMAFPLFNSLRFSFYSSDGFTPKEFIGFGNYVDLFTNPNWKDKFWNALRNTLVFFAINMGFQNVMALIFATFIDSKIKGKGFFKVVVFIPLTLSVLITGFLWKLILNPNWGIVNKFFMAVGLNQFALPWLGDTNTALICVTLVSCWQWIGFPTMLFLAGLQTISGDIYEAADIDGASGWRVFWMIKLPLIVPVIGIVSILTFVGNFNAFDIIFAMTGSRGTPEYSTDLLGSFFYRTAIAGEHPVAQPNMGIGASIAAVIFAILLIGVVLWFLLRNRQEKK